MEVSIDQSNRLRFKKYYENPDTFIFVVLEEDDDSDMFVTYVEDFQEYLESIGFKPRVLFNSKEPLRKNSINHCFLAKEKMSTEKWWSHSHPVTRCIWIKDVTQYSVEDLAYILSVNEPVVCSRGCYELRAE